MRFPPLKPDRELLELLIKNSKRELTKEEYEEQKKSWARGNMPTGDYNFD